MLLPIIMHVNYCEQGQSLEEICLKAVSWGFDGVEFRQRRIGVDEGVEEYLDAISNAVLKSGLKEVLFGYPCTEIMIENETQRENIIKDVSRFYMLAAERFKLGVCNAFTGPLINPDLKVSYFDCTKHGSSIASEDHWKWAVDGFKVMGGLAEKLGFRFAFETHMGYLHDTPSSAKKLVDLINSPAVGVNLDYANIIYFENVPSLDKTISIIGDKLYYVHLKNSRNAADGSKIPTLLGEGEINNRLFLKLLKKSGYNGPICIEGYMGGDREWYAQKDLVYIKSVIKDIG